jgi:hypothetical protein
MKILGIVCSLFVAGLVMLSGNHSVGASPTSANGVEGNHSHGAATAKQAFASRKLELPIVVNTAPSVDRSLIWDDGSAEDTYGYGSSNNTSCAGIWLNRFSTNGFTLPLTIDTIKIPWATQTSGSLNGLPFRLLVYLDADGDGDPSNATLIHQSVQTMHVYDPNTFDTYSVNVAVNSPGNLYIGWEDYWAESEPAPFMYSAAVDTSIPQGHSYFVGDEYDCTPDFGNLADYDIVSRLDTIPGLNPANLLVRAYGTDAAPRCPGQRYTDVCPGDPFYEPITYLSNHGAISGYNDGSFQPNNNTTRAQLCKIVVLAMGWAINTSGGPHFSDEPASDVFYPFVETAYHHSIISGYSNGTFGPGDNVSRAQTCKIIVAAQGWVIDTSGGPHFTDVHTTDALYGYIETAYHHGVISGYGDGTFQPGSEVTRGQLCKILYSAIPHTN